MLPTGPAPGAATTPTARPGVPAVRLVRATRTYGSGTGAVRALDGVDVVFPAGTFTAVMGPSGSGKSTLLQAAAGLDRLDSGHALLGEVDLGTLGEPALTELRRDRVGFVFQAFNLLPALSARENVLLPLRLAGRRPDPRWWDRVVAATGLGDRWDHRPDQLSGGQQQRVALARALITRPAVVFADEPTGALDRRSGAGVLHLLRTVVDRLGQTVVMVTHDPGAAAAADRTIVLADGRVVGGLPRTDAATIAAHLAALEAPAARRAADGTGAR